jgi:biotin carboxylase
VAEITNSEWVDHEYEQMLYDLRRRVPERFVITHNDASMFVEDLLVAAYHLELRIITDEDGVEVAYATDDPAKVEAYKSMVAETCWQVFDSLNCSFVEANPDE